jgi:N-methylhydantoinase B
MEHSPIIRELIKNALVTIADNMLVSIVRTSRSTVVKNNLDFSAAICDGSGQLIAQGLALPAHLGAIMPALRGCLDLFGNDVSANDILCTNDPYSGGSHLNDLFMFKPVDVHGKRLVYLCLILHHTDMGGRVPGGNATDSTEIYQEGLRLPPLKICSGGKINESLLRIIEANVRVSDRVLGDIRAQIAAVLSGEKELLKLIEDYDVDEFREYMTDLIDYTERLTRNSILALPNGEAQFTDWNDDDGTGHGPVRVQVKVLIEDDEVIVDFTGTSPQTSGALNPNYWYTVSNAYAAIRSLMDPAMPNNAGFYRPITVIAPEGCFLNPRFPAPVGARGQAGFRVRATVLGALAQLVPSRLPACTGGSEFGVVIAGRDNARQPFLLLEFHNVTGHGGGPSTDGQDAGPFCLSNLANVPVEVLEAENPVMIDEYSFLPNTGGAGKYRGALGIVRQYRLLTDKAMIQVRSDRQKFPPWGLFGGKPGAGGKTILNPCTKREERLPSKFIRQIEREDVFRAELPGSGGYGDPFERAPEAVAEDVRQEKITAAHALTTYGVVIDAKQCRVNSEKTVSLRRQMALERTAALK